MDHRTRAVGPTRVTSASSKGDELGELAPSIEREVSEEVEPANDVDRRASDTPDVIHLSLTPTVSVAVRDRPPSTSGVALDGAAAVGIPSVPMFLEVNWLACVGEN